MIISLRALSLPAALMLLLYLLPSVAFADSEETEKLAQRYKWFLTVYGGAHAQPDLEHVLTLQMHFEDDTYIAVAALAREFWHYENWISFEVEGQVGKYFGQEHQGQFNGLIIARWHRFPWDQYVDTSFAVGDGLSYNTKVSKVEEEDDDDAGHWLNYLLFELTMGLPQYPHWDAVYRIHHRSGIHGFIGDGGSNFVTFGVKYSF